LIYIANAAALSALRIFYGAYADWTTVIAAAVTTASMNDVQCTTYFLIQFKAEQQSVELLIKTSADGAEIIIK